MKIIINTLGRVNNQITWKNLPESVRAITQFSVQHHEKDLYGDLPIIVLPESIKNLPDTRQWLIDNCDDRYLIIMDDDLSFFHRENDDPKKLYKNEPRDTENMFEQLFAWLKSGIAMVGVSAREGNNRVETGHVLVARSMRILGFDLNKVKSSDARFDRTKTKEDMDMTLQLLRNGHANLVLYNFANDHVSSNAPGGCALYRTLELMEKDAHTLAALHPGFVKVVKKQTKTSWNGLERTDVVVQWKKAFASSQPLP